MYDIYIYTYICIVHNTHHMAIHTSTHTDIQAYLSFKYHMFYGRHILFNISHTTCSLVHAYVHVLLYIIKSLLELILIIPIWLFEIKIMSIHYEGKEIDNTRLMMAVPKKGRLYEK
jgi:hypothetical protein